MARSAIVLFLCSLSVSAYAMADNTAKHPINIAAQDLGAALEQLSRQSGTDLVYRPEQVKGLKTHGAVGEFSAQEAVTRLLEGTKLTVSEDPSGALLIAAPLGGGTASDTPSPGGQTGRPSDRSSLQLAQLDQAPAGPQVDKKKAGEKQEAIDEVVVTGTHIRGAQPSSPITTISSEDIATSGYTNIADLMRTLPQNSAAGASPQTLTGSGPNGTGATNFAAGSAPNLRGLGPGSTLTLVNGHRLPQDSPQGGVDITQIPVDAIDRVEVVTDGASATYGSDAVAGVINFILKQSFDGSQTSASFGDSTDGGGRDWRVSELIGKSWTGGSILAVYEHEQQNSVDASQRTFTSTVAGPYSLLPQTTRDSAFGSIRQGFGNLDVHLDGLYTSREADFYQTVVGQGTFYVPSPVRSYDGTIGLKYSLPASWQLSAFGSYGKQTSSFQEFLLPAQGLQTAESFDGTTRTAEVNADGRLVELPTGPAQLALGGGNRLETYSDRNPSGPAKVSASRRINYGFAELNVPLLVPSERTWLRALNLDLAGRYEDYSDFGHKSVPKVGLVYVPFKELKVRASASRSFRAPTLTQVDQLQSAFLIDIPDPESKAPNGLSQVLAALGGKPGLQPETATTETVGLEFSPTWVDGLSVSPTYFHIDYKNRIGVINSGFLALTDPTNAAFVTRDPSVALQQSIISVAQAEGGFADFSGVPYNPATLPAVVDARPINVGQQTIEGMDLLITYSRSAAVGSIKTFLNGNYINIRQQLTPTSPIVSLAGTAFNPPRYRARGGATWTVGSWALTGAVNYTGHETNTLQADQPEISSWTTVDAQIAYTLPALRALDGIRVSFSALNVFDRNPPFVEFNVVRQGFNYDVVNASPLGRYVTVQAVIPVSW